MLLSYRVDISHPGSWITLPGKGTGQTRRDKAHVGMNLELLKLLAVLPPALNDSFQVTPAVASGVGSCNLPRLVLVVHGANTATGFSRRIWTDCLIYTDVRDDDLYRSTSGSNNATFPSQESPGSWSLE